MQDEIVPAPESETPGYGPKSEIAPGSLKIVCTPEATGDDNSRLEKFVEYTFQAIYIDWRRVRWRNSFTPSPKATW